MVEDLKTKQHMSEIIPYDKAWSQEIDFEDYEQESPADKVYNILQNAGFEQQLIEKGSVNILAKDLPFKN